jgi:filamentous hemagglutinin
MSPPAMFLRYTVSGMIGMSGAQFTSKTLWEGEAGDHIDVENPNPGQRPGQIHYQDANDAKFQYNFEKGEFEGLSNTHNKNLLENPDVQNAIQKGFKYLGINQP